MSSTFKNIISIVFAVACIAIALHYIKLRDERILNGSINFGTQTAAAITAHSETERRIAQQFADTTLPQLRKLGLITNYTRTEVETIITVSGRIWNKRSQFFKESLLEQLFVYNTVNEIPIKTIIIDDRTAKLYAEISSSQERIIY